MELIKSTRFLCLALMIKYTCKRMDVMDYLVVMRVNYRKLLKTIKKGLCQANCFNFFSSRNSFFVKHSSFNFFSSGISLFFFTWPTKFEKRKALETELNEKLIHVAWHADRWWDWGVPDDEKKETYPMFIDEL